ncbi:hypothetical protein M422DRAFT_239640 [Sphaerobolus stellatus SS14]|nr:hypothetical protein M422DRAFT_239640 [Sphaerobolus stellatus SS14]
MSTPLRHYFYGGAECANFSCPSVSNVHLYVPDSAGPTKYRIPGLPDAFSVSSEWLPWVVWVLGLETGLFGGLLIEIHRTLGQPQEKLVAEKYRPVSPTPRAISLIRAIRSLNAQN